jgi:hypothetical protein
MAMPGPSLESRVRGICTALPGVSERDSHGAPAFFAGKQFVMFWPEGHHDHRFPHLWCAAPPGAQEGLIASDPGRFFRPPYVGHRGWVGVRLDGEVDWDQIADLCEDAFRAVASKRLIEALVSGPGEPGLPQA